jgi:dimethylhistidine N-methyltransferase
MIARELVGLPAWAWEVEQGLRRVPKSLPAKLFYDAVGSALFEQITRLPEYYLSRTETGILQQQAAEIARAVGPGVTLVELGAGSAAKTCTLLQAFTCMQLRVAYYAVDISAAALAEARSRIATQCPTVSFRPILADLNHGFDFLRPIPGRKLVAYLGSSIGNFDLDVAVQLFRDLRACLGQGDALLLGADMVKPIAPLLAAYNDSQDITAAFNKNMLGRLNRELGANFDLDRFGHVAVWNGACSRIEMHLESMCRQTVQFAALRTSVTFAAGERIHTENSYKYTPGMLRKLLQQGGFSPVAKWTDPQEWFAVNLARI